MTDHSIPTDKEIAQELLDTLPEEAETMMKWFSQRFPEDASALRYAAADNSFAVGILMALLDRTKADRPPLLESQALAIVKVLNGIQLPPLPYQGLPSILASEVSEGMVQEEDAEPLRREIEDGITEPELQEHLAQLPPRQLHAFLQSLSPEAALAIVVGAYFWWAQRDLLPEHLVYEETPESFRLGHFFKLVA